MARNTVRLNSRGIAEVAKSSEVAREITALAERVADNVRGQGIQVEGVPGNIALPVEVTSTTTTDMRLNRAKSYVTLAHAAGLAVQAKHGALTKAAAQAGLEVRS